MGLRYARAIPFRNSNTSPWWIEATHRMADGRIYAWYHHEVYGMCADNDLAVPEIGAAVSNDDGNSFVDLGVVLQTGKDPDCNAKNGYFAGGHGDFSVILAQQQRFFYFYFSVYDGLPGEHGIAMARMAIFDKTQPAGKLMTYFHRD